MKKRQIIQTTIIVGFIALVVAFAWARARYRYDVKDTLACVFTTGRHATRYATGYSESAFAQIRTGMTREEVINHLGQPLEQVTYASLPGEEWKYSQAATRSGHFHLRAVRFTPDGKVSNGVKRFHFD